MKHFDEITWAFGVLSLLVLALTVRWAIVYRRELRQTKQVLKDGLDINYSEQPTF